MTVCIYVWLLCARRMCLGYLCAIWRRVIVMIVCLWVRVCRMLRVGEHLPVSCLRLVPSAIAMDARSCRVCARAGWLTTYLVAYVGVLSRTTTIAAHTTPPVASGLVYVGQTTIGGGSSDVTLAAGPMWHSDMHEGIESMYAV